MSYCSNCGQWLNGLGGLSGTWAAGSSTYQAAQQVQTEAFRQAVNQKPFWVVTRQGTNRRGYRIEWEEAVNADNLVVDKGVLLAYARPQDSKAISSIVAGYCDGGWVKFRKGIPGEILKARKSK